jgi:hypothetical protein
MNWGRNTLKCEDVVFAISLEGENALQKGWGGELVVTIYCFLRYVCLNFTHVIIK